MARESLPDHPVPLRLYLLGSFRLERSGQTIRLATHKAESLLAYLALSRKETGHSREKLAALLWGDSPDALARSSLRRGLVLLRKALGHDLVLANRDTVQIDPAYPLWVDALEFQAQAERLINGSPGVAVGLDTSLYQDDLLVDYYDEWITPFREHLRSLLLESLLKLSDSARIHGQYERAVQYARMVLQRDAANETAHQTLMSCYWKMGKRSAALNQYQECERILEHELGVKPSPETMALYRTISDHGHSVQETAQPSFARLPVPLTAFIGREHELAEIKALLPTTRLLTLTGAGGSGKTRLAIQAAADVQSDFLDGVGWVDLSQLINPTLLPHTVSHALGIYEVPARPLEDSIADYLRPRHSLLVLDNCEHLVEACADLVERLLRSCPQLKILATSRQLLNVAGEIAWIVPSLALPASDQPLLYDNEAYDAVQLFAERARAAQPRFKLTKENWQAVVRICRRLDGIPLAIELAASRVRVLTVPEIESHLDERFHLLVGGTRTALPRHRTMRATIDWSYGLLSEHEKILFRRIAVFAGGFTLQAATRVCGQEPLKPSDILELLSGLAVKSLILVQERDGTSHYHLLETIRQHALEQLLESKEGETLAEQHLDYLLEFASLAAPKLVSAEQRVWLRRLEVEQENLRAALHRALDNPAWCQKGLRLARFLWRYWWHRGEMSEGRQWLERYFAVHADSQDAQDRFGRLEALAQLAHLTWLQDDLTAARPLLEDTVKMSEELRDNKILAYSLAWLSMMANDQGNYEQARRRAEESIRLFRQVDEPWGLSYAMFVRGRASLSLGDLDDARSFYQASVSQFRHLGDRWATALPLGHLGVIAYRQGDYAAARRFFEERLGIAREFHSKQLICFALGYLAQIALHTHQPEQAGQFLVEGLRVAQGIGSKARIGDFLYGLGQLAALLGQTKHAVQLFAAAEAQLQALAISREPREQNEHENRLREMRARMSDADFAEAWAAGQSMPLEEAVRYGLNTV